MGYICTVKHYAGFKKEKILYVITWMNVDFLIISEIRHSQKKTLHEAAYMMYLETSNSYMSGILIT